MWFKPILLSIGFYKDNFKTKMLHLLGKKCK